MSRHVSPTPPVAGRYVLGTELGRGGCAIVYEAFDVRLGKLVALKLVRHDAREGNAPARLEREARAAAAVRHPNVCSVLDAGVLEDRRPFMVMERLHGETLTQCLRRLRCLTVGDAIHIARQVLAALGATHASGIVHRDVKPDNVFLVPQTYGAPFVKLLDFGMCRKLVATTPRDDLTLTRAGQVVGTPEYMSPEQVSGKRAFDPRLDLYAVGVILHEMLSGTRAFPGKDAREVIRAVLSKDLPLLHTTRADIPPEVDRIIARAVARNLSARYPSAAHFHSDLFALERSLAQTSVAPQPPDETGPRRKKGFADGTDSWNAPTKVCRTG